MQWWLISDEDVKIIRAALEAPTHEANKTNCEEQHPCILKYLGPGFGCNGCKGNKKRQDAVHILDSGLHQTDAVSNDFR